MNKIKKYFLELKNKKIKAKSQAAHFNVNYDKAKTVGILFSSQHIENIDSLTNFIKTLQQDGKQVKSLTFVDTQVKDNLKVYNFNHHLITDKDITFFGEINSFLVDDFVKTEFDYLFCIEIVESPVFDNILSRSHAKCRVGKFIEGQSNLELMIKMNDNGGTSELMKQMYHYVKTIKND